MQNKIACIPNPITVGYLFHVFMPMFPKIALLILKDTGEAIKKNNRPLMHETIHLSLEE